MGFGVKGLLNPKPQTLNPGYVGFGVKGFTVRVHTAACVWPGDFWPNLFGLFLYF